MKKLFVILMIAMPFVWSCTSKPIPPEEKAKNAAIDYLKERLNDPNSYQLVYANADRYGKDDYKKRAWQVNIEYRAKNSFGALILEDKTFDLDSNFHVIEYLAIDTAKIN